MTPEFILRASLCREPHCANGNWKPAAISEIENLGYASAYAESGYTQPAKGILFANWNYFPSDVTGILERSGYAIEWSDEWTTCSNCGNAIRTTANSYGWQPAYAELQGDTLCIPCLNGDAGDYLESLEDNPNTALNIPSIDPSEWGYAQSQDGFESGFHPGQNDDPKAIYKRLKESGHMHILFQVDSVGQFDLRFSVWAKTTE
jgi:hypothetical protein